MQEEHLKICQIINEKKIKLYNTDFVQVNFN